MGFIFFSHKLFHWGKHPFFPKSWNFTLQREIGGSRVNINHEPEFSLHNFYISSHQALSQKLHWDFLPFFTLTEGRAFLCFFKVKSTDLTVQNSVFPLEKYSNIFHGMTAKLQPPNPKTYNYKEIKPPKAVDCYHKDCIPPPTKVFQII